MKKLLIFVTVLIIAIGGTYYAHRSNLDIAKKESGDQIAQQEKEYDQILQRMKTKFQQENPNEAYLFDQLNDEQKAISFVDTTVSLLFFSDHFEKTLIDLNYPICVYAKATSEAINKRSDGVFYQLRDELTEKHGAIVEMWVTRLGKERFITVEEKNECKPYFSDNNSYTVDPLAFSEFDRFLSEYKIYNDKIQAQNAVTANKLANEISKLKRDLNAEARSVMDAKVNLDNAIISSNQNFTFNWKGYGNFDYSIPMNEIDHEYIEREMNDVYVVQYKYNSLQNGAMPYGYCFGTTNSGRSGVRVNAGSSDVIVTIKNMNDRVIRHAYIKARRSYTLNLPDGNYEVFFYYGSGWNPKRFMKDTDCGRLVGGFLSNEYVSKDPNVLRLYSGIMEYTLTEQIGGNFSTAGSSKTEAF